MPDHASSRWYRAPHPTCSYSLLRPTASPSSAWKIPKIRRPRAVRVLVSACMGRTPGRPHASAIDHARACVCPRPRPSPPRHGGGLTRPDQAESLVVNNGGFPSLFFQQARETHEINF
uniref:Uncharacterized protein n=1 Tax=Oryza sativa subsp. japonica TaxID=39947 RepID=Q84ZJ7_ORYSJ|nr:hypothetical protein [Oryza sativa Japonica Group]BAD30413.1 hypothetical protein [Oryza sativa Japonica Group]